MTLLGGRDLGLQLVRGGFATAYLFRNRAPRRLGGFDLRNPAVLFTPEDIVALLPGLVVERAERVRRPVEGSEASAIDALVRARRTWEKELHAA